jgi:phosphatidylserine/phosphatidylglycerophosphate/cardiolipin synthase-like enzyme
VIEPLLALGGHDLSVLADALRERRLVAPFTDAAVGRFITSSVASLAVAQCLRQLDAASAPAGVIVAFLEGIVHDRRARPRTEESIDLVASGPEAVGATNRDTRAVVREMFTAAERSVTVVGYAVYQGKKVFEALARRADERPELAVRMFLDVQRARVDQSLSSQIVQRFAQRFRAREWPGTRMPEVYHDPRSLETDGARRSSLHAKCVVVDRSVAFISSTNFTEAAQKRNIEIGVLIRSVSFADRLDSHFDALAASGIVVRVPGL